MRSTLQARLPYLILLLTGLLASPAASQTLLHQIEPPDSGPVNSFFAETVSGVPDADGDGRGDLLVGARDAGEGRAGRAYLFSGATGQLLHTISSPNPSPETLEENSGYFGYAVRGVPDANGDGRGDLLIGAPGETRPNSPILDGGGNAYLFSGATGELLYTLAPPPNTFGGLGLDVSGVPDTDGDGNDDLLVSGGVSGGRNVVHLFSAATGQLLRTLIEPTIENGTGFGTAVSGVPDLNGDGRGDVLVGAPTAEGVAGDDPEGNQDDYGRAYVFSGATGELLYTLETPNTVYSHFGESVAGIADLDGDGQGDLLIGAPIGFVEEYTALNGRAYLFSGATGEIIYTLTSPTETAETNSEREYWGDFGYAVSEVLDANGDGKNDLLIGAHRETVEDTEEAGRAYLFSGATGERLVALSAPTSVRRGRFGFAVSGVPDVNGDGKGDLLVGQDQAYLFSADVETTTPLPVELTAFSAVADGGHVDLSWQTASEVNNAGFHVEGRRPGETTYEPLAFLEGSGTTPKATTYRYRTSELAPGRYRFRLKQVDHDGLASYSAEIEAAVELAERFVLEPAYPNPFNPQATVRFALRESEEVRVALYDLLGRRVALLFEGRPVAGEMQAVMIDGAGLPSGTYVVRLTGHSFSQTQAVTLMK